MNVRCVFQLVLVTRKLIIEVFFNGFIDWEWEYTFLIRLDLMLSMSLGKEFQLLQILNDLFIKHLVKLLLYENDVKLLKFKRRPV